MNVSLMGEYYKLAGDEEWTLFPQAQLTYQHSARHIFQLAFSSDKQYANYWDKQDYIRYADGYTEVHGNPALKPYNNYTGQLSYILKQKYIYSLFIIFISRIMLCNWLINCLINCLLSIRRRIGIIIRIFV